MQPIQVLGDLISSASFTLPLTENSVAQYKSERIKRLEEWSYLVGVGMEFYYIRCWSLLGN